MIKLFIPRKKLIAFLINEKIDQSDWIFFTGRAKESEEDRIRLIKIQAEQDMLNRIINEISNKPKKIKIKKEKTKCLI